MKKCLSLILALTMLFSLGANAFASDLEGEFPEEWIYEAEPFYEMEPAWEAEPFYEIDPAREESFYEVEPVWETESVYEDEPLYEADPIYEVEPVWEAESVCEEEPAYEAETVYETESEKAEEPADESGPIQDILTEEVAFEVNLEGAEANSITSSEPISVYGTAFEVHLTLNITDDLAESGYTYGIECSNNEGGDPSWYQAKKQEGLTWNYEAAQDLIIPNFYVPDMVPGRTTYYRAYLRDCNGNVFYTEDNYKSVTTANGDVETISLDENVTIEANSRFIYQITPGAIGRYRITTDAEYINVYHGQAGHRLNTTDTGELEIKVGAPQMTLIITGISSNTATLSVSAIPYAEKYSVQTIKITDQHNDIGSTHAYFTVSFGAPIPAAGTEYQVGVLFTPVSTAGENFAGDGAWYDVDHKEAGPTPRSTEGAAEDSSVTFRTDGENAPCNNLAPGTDYYYQAHLDVIDQETGIILEQLFGILRTVTTKLSENETPTEDSILSSEVVRSSGTDFTVALTMDITEELASNGYRYGVEAADSSQNSEVWRAEWADGFAAGTDLVNGDFTYPDVVPGDTYAYRAVLGDALGNIIFREETTHYVTTDGSSVIDIARDQTVTLPVNSRFCYRVQTGPSGTHFAETDADYVAIVLSFGHRVNMGAGRVYFGAGGDNMTVYLTGYNSKEGATLTFSRRPNAEEYSVETMELTDQNNQLGSTYAYFSVSYGAPTPDTGKGYQFGVFFTPVKTVGENFSGYEAWGEVEHQQSGPTKIRTEGAPTDSRLTFQPNDEGAADAPCNNLQPDTEYYYQAHLEVVDQETGNILEQYFGTLRSFTTKPIEMIEPASEYSVEIDNIKPTASSATFILRFGAPVPEEGWSYNVGVYFFPVSEREEGFIGEEAWWRDGKYKWRAYTGLKDPVPANTSIIVSDLGLMTNTEYYAQAYISVYEDQNGENNYQFWGQLKRFKTETVLAEEFILGGDGYYQATVPADGQDHVFTFTIPENPQDMYVLYNENTEMPVRVLEPNGRVHAQEYNGSFTYMRGNKRIGATYTINAFPSQTEGEEYNLLIIPLETSELNIGENTNLQGNPISIYKFTPGTAGTYVYYPLTDNYIILFRDDDTGFYNDTIYRYAPYQEADEPVFFRLSGDTSVMIEKAPENDIITGVTTAEVGLTQAELQISYTVSAKTAKNRYYLGIAYSFNANDVLLDEYGQSEKAEIWEGELSPTYLLAGSFTLSRILDQLIPGKTYYYKAFIRDSLGVKQAESELLSFTTSYLKTPELESINQTSSGIEFTWKASDGAELYKVFRKTGTGGWKGFALTSETSYTDTDVEAGIQYTYTVRCTFNDGKIYTSDYNKTGLKITYIIVPTISSVTATTKGVQLKWTKSEGAAKYRIFRKEAGGSWAKLKDVTSTTYTDTTVESGKTYYYRLRCISSAGSYAGGYSSSVKKAYLAAPKLSSVTNTTAGVQIKWTKSAGAAKYRIFRKTGSGSWTKLADVANTKVAYTDKTVKSGTTYSYTVRCLNSSGGYASAYDTTGLKITYLAAPTVSTVAKVTAGVQIKWAKVTGAVKYRVFRKVGSGSWTKLGDTTAVKYTDKTAKSGTTYSYTVRCISSDGKTYTSSYDTTGKSITVK